MRRLPVWLCRGPRTVASTALLVTIGLSLVASAAGADQSGADRGADGKSVTMTVGPRWGSSIAGAWTTYSVNVRNDGDSELDADVVLVADDAAPTSATPNSTARRWPSYRSHITVFGGGEAKTVTTVVLEAPSGYRAELRGRSGGLVASARANAPRRGFRRYTVALLSAVPGAGTTLGKAPGALESQLVVTQFASPREVPHQAMDFIGLDAIVIDDFDTAGLGSDQLGALRDFVSLGGSLVVAGGAASARTVAPLPAELVPLRPVGTQNASVAPLADLVLRPTDASSTVTVGELRGGRLVLGGKDGPPLVVVDDERGAGLVAQLAYDPLVEPFASDAVLRGVALDQGLARVLPPTGFAIQKPVLTPDNRLGPVAIGLPPGESSRHAPGRAPPRRVLVRSWPAWSLAVLVLYLVTTVAYCVFVLRRRRPRLRAWLGANAAWAVVAVVAVIVTHPGVISVPGLTPGGERVFQIETLSPTGAILVTKYEALTISNSPVVLAADAGASTVFVPPAPTRVGSDSRADVDTNAVYVTGGGEIVRGPGVSKLKRLRTKTPSLQTISIDHGPPGLETDLRRIGPYSPGGRLVGTVTNRGSRPLYRLRAQMSAPDQGNQASLAEVLAPGATINVDAPLMAPVRWCFLPDCPRLGSSAGRRVQDATMFAAADQAIGRQGQISLVALAESPSATPRPDNPSAPVRVVVQTASLSAPYGQQITGRRVALVLADSASAATYEARVPGNPVGRPSLQNFESNPDDQPPFDVFDWESYSWRRLDISGALRPSEYANGVVRVRVQSPAPPSQVVVDTTGAPG